MTSSIRWIAASVAVGTAVALLWLRAPVVPSVIGAAGAGILLYVRARRATP